MAEHRLGILACLSLIIRIDAVGLAAAPSTLTQASSTGTALALTSPLPTPPPSYKSYEAPYICGWIDYKFSNSYTCAGNNTCLWNSDIRRVGCGRTDSINYYTSCVPYHAAQFCDSSCFANPSIVKCGSQIPHCVTPRIGPIGSYSILACQSDHPLGEYSVHLTYDGQTSVQHLPRYLGYDSRITYGTSTPLPATDSEAPWPDATSTTATATEPFVYFITPFPAIGDGHHPHRNWSVTNLIAQYEHAQRAKQIIVGCTVGGSMFLLIGSLGLWLAYAWKQRQTLRLIQETKQGQVGLQSLAGNETSSMGSETAASNPHHQP